MEKQIIDNPVVYKSYKNTIKDKSSEDFIYINIWAIGCEPCLREIPFLLTLKTYFQKKIDCYFVSPHSDEAVNVFLNKHKIEKSNSIFLNEMRSFIEEIFREIEVNTIAFPTHIIMNKDGQVLAFYCGSINSEEQAAPIIDFVNSLQ